MRTILRYPLESPPDYMKIQSFEYKSRTARKPGQNRLKGDGPVVNTYILPFPEMPNMVSQQKYGQISGALNNALATGLGEAYNAVDNAISNGTQADVSSIAERLKSRIIDDNGGAGPVAREFFAGMAGQISGINGSMFQTLATGEISNPNIETLYSGPTLRSYSFNWTMAPKSASEATRVYEIVRNLKRNHLPTSDGVDGQSTGMLRAPNYFQLRLYTNKKPADQYQKFFPCVLESLSFKQDSTGQHISLPNGEPVISSLSLVFKEIQITTADDFLENI